jgi:hypothetical protein
LSGGGGGGGGLPCTCCLEQNSDGNQAEEQRQPGEYGDESQIPNLFVDACRARLRLYSLDDRGGELGRTNEGSHRGFAMEEENHVWDHGGEEPSAVKGEENSLNAKRPRKECLSRGEDRPRSEDGCEDGEYKRGHRRRDTDVVDVCAGEKKLGEWTSLKGVV